MTLLTEDTSTAIISSMSAIVMICMAIIGWFMMASLKESRQNTLDIGVLKGTIEANRSKSHDDIESLSSQTDLKIQHTTESVEMLARSVSKLMDLFLNTQYKNDNN